MAQIANPRKQFQFSIFVTGFGFNPFLAQKVTLPDHEVEVAEHGDTNFIVKTGGIMKYGMLAVEKISTALGPERWVWNWQREVQNVLLGGGTLPISYKRIIEIVQFGVDGITVINQWTYFGCWPQKINGIEYNRQGSDNVIESIDFCVDQHETF